MSVEFNKAILLDNISFRLKKMGKKIGEFENEVGVSLGYLSRMSKEGNSKPGIDFVMKAADVLHVSIDTLLSVELYKMTPTEEYLISFIEKLTKDTINDRLNWNCESAWELNNDIEVFGKDGECSHPLFWLETLFEEGGEYPRTVTKPVFKSRAFDVYTYINGDCYNLQMKNGAVLYIMNIRDDSYTVSTDDAYAKEIWISPQRGPNQFLSSTKDAQEIASLIEALYAEISESVRHPKVNKDIRNIIDAYLHDDELSDDISF